MAKTMIREKKATSQDAKKQHKKRAKQEAKLMLKVEEAKKAVQKAEAKVAKAQTTLHGHNSELHKLEDQLTHLRSDQQEPSAEAAQASAPAVSSPQAEQDNHSKQNGSYSSNGAYDAPDAHGASQAAATDAPAIPKNQIDAQPPAEGRVDVSQDVAASATADAAASGSNVLETPDQSLQQAEESLHIDSGEEGSMPIVTDNPQAWPPPEVRKEVADAILEEVKHPHGNLTGQAADTANAANAARAGQANSGEVSPD